MRWLFVLLLSTSLTAQEPPETPKPQEDPKKPEAPRRAPAAAPLPKIQGLSDDFPLGEEVYLPDYKAQPVIPPKENAAAEVKPDDKPKGPGFFSSLFSGDKTFLNILILCALAGIFVLYRLRGRK